MQASLSETLSKGRVGVVLSSGFFGFYAHAGFVQALGAAGIRSHVYAGSSAGALVAGFCAGGELDAFIPQLTSLRRKDFWDPAIRMGRPWGLLKGRRFLSLLDKLLPVKTFEVCKTPILTVATDLDSGERRVDTSGLLVPAIASSCALPFLFQPVVREGRRLADGGIIDKAPIEALIDHYELDALLVHLIHSRNVGIKAPSAPRKFLGWCLDNSRNASWRTQAALAEARGIPTYIIETEPSSIGPFSMKRGAKIIEQTRKRVAAQLSQETLYFSAGHLLKSSVHRPS